MAQTVKLQRLAQQAQASQEPEAHQRIVGKAADKVEEFALSRSLSQLEALLQKAEAGRSKQAQKLAGRMINSTELVIDEVRRFHSAAGQGKSEEKSRPNNSA